MRSNRAIEFTLAMSQPMNNICKVVLCVWVLLAGLLVTKPLLAEPTKGKIAPTSITSAHSLQVSEARVRHPIPGQSMTVGYVSLFNPTDNERLLIHIDSPHAERVEMHEHRHENGMMKMRQLTQLVLPAKTRIDFKPGGYHLMLYAVQQPLPVLVPIRLHFGSGESVEFQAKVVHLNQEQH